MDYVAKTYFYKSLALGSCASDSSNLTRHRLLSRGGCAVSRDYPLQRSAEHPDCHPGPEAPARGQHEGKSLAVHPRPEDTEESG